MYDYKSYAPVTNRPQRQFMYRNGNLSAPMRSETDMAKIFESPKQKSWLYFKS